MTIVKHLQEEIMKKEKNRSQNIARRNYERERLLEMSKHHIILRVF
jgi:hypothetical protein